MTAGAAPLFAWGGAASRTPQGVRGLTPPHHY
ncbi:hypothetical protein [Akkermansia phage Chantilly]|nr:hypothetical protein [Akkermansia phage Chantilly]